MLRKGFTLIELLIVITIIAILAGAAIPYVQDYVEDTRLAKVRSDLNELRNALIRYETTTGRSFGYTNETKTATDTYASEAADLFQQELVGPYLQSTLTDPWGSPYYLSNASSTVYSAGRDGATHTHVIETSFRPRLSPTRAYWYDIDKAGKVTENDQLRVRFTRRLKTVDGTGFEASVGGSLGTTASATASIDTNDARYAVITIGKNPTLRPGSHTLDIDNSPDITDAGDKICASMSVEIKPAQ